MSSVQVQVHAEYLDGVRVNSMVSSDEHMDMITIAKIMVTKDTTVAQFVQALLDALPAWWDRFRAWPAAVKCRYLKGTLNQKSAFVEEMIVFSEDKEEYDVLYPGAVKVQQLLFAEHPGIYEVNCVLTTEEVKDIN